MDSNKFQLRRYRENVNKSAIRNRIVCSRATLNPAVNLDELDEQCFGGIHIPLMISA